jgi:Kef-type K+ transport system membrane component KefB
VVSTTLNSGAEILALPIITDVLIVLAAALLVGELFEQFCLPSVVGEILSGMIIGPSVLGLIVTDVSVNAVSSVALFFIIFHIGFEMKTHMVRGKLFSASLLSVTSFLVPLALTVLASLVFFSFGFQADFIVALAIAIPSISLVSMLVLQYNLLNTATGHLILSSVTISDVLSFIILAGVVRPLRSTLTIVAEILIFTAAFVALDYILNSKPEEFRRLLGRVSRVLRREDFSYVFLIIVGLAVSVIFQSIGLSYILGAFFAGLVVHDGLIGREPYKRISKTLSTMNRVFFIPLFFGFAGLEVMLQTISFVNYVGLAVVTAIALGVGVALTYYVTRKALQKKMNIVPKQVAGVLGGRGAIGIVIATIALNEGAINNAGFSLVILATLIISLIVPFLAGRMCRRPAE